MSKVVGIYLAAGKSQRFNGNKLQAKFGKQTLGSHALKAAIQSRLDQIVIVTKVEDTLAWIPPQLKHDYHHKWKHVICPESAYGLAYSIRCGLQTAQQLGANAIVVLLADQPLVNTMMINNLLKRYMMRQTVGFIATVNHRIPCPPILFTENMYKDLKRLVGDIGARKLIRDRTHDGEFIPVDSWRLVDIDTRSDYQKLLGKQNL